MALAEGIVPSKSGIEVAKMIALMVSLYPVVEEIGVSKQLERVKKLWGCGHIDQQPAVYENTLSLNLYFNYPDLKQIFGNSGAKLGLPHACIPLKNSVSLTISLEEDINKNGSLLVGSSYKQTSLLGRIHGGVVSSGEIQDTRKGIVLELKSTPFDKDDPAKAKELLENQIDVIASKSTCPLELAEEARKRIKSDPYLSVFEKLHHCPELFTPLLWYKKTFS